MNKLFKNLFNYKNETLNTAIPVKIDLIRQKHYFEKNKKKIIGFLL